MVYSPPRPATVTAGSQTGVDRDDATNLLRLMTLIRRFEEKSAELYARGKIKGFLHLYVGQEAVAAGVIPELSQQDYIVSHYREHGHAIARGLDTCRLMAELMGKSGGVSGGRGGSMHLIDASKRFMGGYAIVAGQLPLACGLAFASKRERNGGIALAIMGDGAVNEGEFHESLNLAKVWNLPVLFLVENNLYGMGTAAARTSAVTEVHRRAAAYDIAASDIDGMDVLAVRDAARDAIDYVRSGCGPYLLEARTYRFRGHSMADPEFYRDKDEISAWKQSDPIRSFRETALSDGVLSDSDIEAIDASVEAEVEAAVIFALESPEPGLETLTNLVYRGR
ncbi:MAG TPA: pyruvate dehydrogenase (acetyl-transferring) E1 component subunit alpha [Dehalococcoidia bacterium]